MKRTTRRTPKNYDGLLPTNHTFSDLLHKELTRLCQIQKERPDLILASWPEIVGEKMAQCSRAVSLVEGTITVIVGNATLYSLLRQHPREQEKLLRTFQHRFPHARIERFRFRMGS